MVGPTLLLRCGLLLRIRGLLLCCLYWLHWLLLLLRHLLLPRLLLRLRHRMLLLRRCLLQLRRRLLLVRLHVVLLLILPLRVGTILLLLVPLLPRGRNSSGSAAYGRRSCLRRLRRRLLQRWS